MVSDVANVGVSPAEATAWAKERFSGYVTIATTPYDSSGRIDEEGVRHNIERTIALPGAGGIYVGSMYQEFWTLTLAERARLLEVVLDVTRGKVPVMVGVMDDCVDNVLQLARHAQDKGAEMIMLWPPRYGPRDETSVLEYFRRVSREVTIGICTYSTTMHELGFYITPEFMLRLVDEVPRLCAVKEASLSAGRYTAMVEKAGDAILVSCPLEEYQLPGIAAFGHDRAPGVLLGTSRPIYLEGGRLNLCGEFAKSIARGGDLSQAWALLPQIMAVANPIHNAALDTGVHNIALIKQLSAHLGFVAGPARPPMSDATDQQVSDALDVLRRVGVLDADTTFPEPTGGQ